jgi:YD repeat-containing protein
MYNRVMREVVGRSSVVGSLSPWLCLSGSLLAACSEPEPDWPPPPTDAAATCLYEVEVGSIPKSTIYFDAQDRVMRVDGFAIDDDDDVYRASYFFDYDEQGRLVGRHGPHGDVQVTYSDQQIITSSDDINYSYDLVDGRVVTWQGPLLLPETQRNRALFEYDAAGRITRQSGAIRVSKNDGNGTWISQYDNRYTYDAQGRVITAERDGRTTTIAYTDFPRRLVINFETFEDLPLNHTERWTIDYDEEHRITTIMIDIPGNAIRSYVFTYSDGAWTETRDPGGVFHRMLTATGRCAPPSLTFAPPPWLPIRWSADMVTPRFVDHFPLKDVL